MVQLLNLASLLVLAAAAASVRWRRLHLALVTLVAGTDLSIVFLLQFQRAVLNRAGHEALRSPVTILHVGSAILATCGIVLCLSLAWRRWWRDLAIHWPGIAALVLTLVLRSLSYGTSFLMRSL